MAPRSCPVRSKTERVTAAGVIDTAADIGDSEGFDGVSLTRAARWDSTNSSFPAIGISKR